ncbi:transcription factor 15-like [Rhineura floridana]|uniref:transcription factor 15-like n=1 Tax=Rhineura floridana TaxID=261503 RepID=UPI002AC810D1|nr:transcription factor 15-like [Rhineura floridana]
MVMVRQQQEANARERARTQSLNTAFTALRTLIPIKHVSKAEMLRLAFSYIAHLTNILLMGKDGEERQPCFSALYGTKGEMEDKQAKSICMFCLSNQKKGGQLVGACFQNPYLDTIEPLEEWATVRERKGDISTKTDCGKEPSLGAIGKVNALHQEKCLLAWEALSPCNKAVDREQLLMTN